MSLLDDEIQSKNDEQNEKNKLDSKYERTVPECNKYCSLFQIIVGRNIKVISKTELDSVELEYDKIVNSSEISNCDEIDGVWKQSNDIISPAKTHKI